MKRITKQLIIFGTVFFLGTSGFSLKNVKMSKKYSEGTNKYIKSFEDDSFEIAAHRGFSSLEVENTKEAIQVAAEKDYIDYIEIDARLTKDGMIVLSHDDKIKSNSIGRILVSNTYYDDLCDDSYKYTITNLNIRDIGCLLNKEAIIVSRRSYDLLNKNYNIICLRDGINFCDDKKIILDLKFKDNMKEFCNALDSELDGLDTSKIIFQCEDLDSLLYLKKRNPEYEYSAIISKKKDLSYIDNFENVTLKKNLVNFDLVSSLIDDGKSVMIWTLNDTDDINKIIIKLDYLYDDVIYITDYPDVMFIELSKTKKKKK